MWASFVGHFVNWFFFQQFIIKYLFISCNNTTFRHGTLGLKRPQSEAYNTLTSILQLYSVATLHLCCLSASYLEKCAICLLVQRHYFIRQTS